MSLLDTLPHRCSIYRRARSNDAVLGSVETPILVQSGVHCWEQPMSVSEQMKYGKDGMTINTKVYFNSDPGITDRSQIVITHRTVAGVLTSVAAADRVSLQNLQSHRPDRSAGLGLLFMVVGNNEPGAST